MASDTDHLRALDLQRMALTLLVKKERLP